MSKDEPRQTEVVSVEAERAAQLAVGRLRRHWVEGNDELTRLAQAELDPDPLVIHDLAGPALFYDFTLTAEDETVGIVRAAATTAIGTPLVATHLGARGWDLDDATRAAEEAVRKSHKGAKVTGSRVVCYCYPKLGIEVSFDVPRKASRRAIVDVSDGRPVVNLGADEPEGSTAYSYYEVVVVPTAERRRRRWERHEEELELLNRVAPVLHELDTRIEGDARDRLNDALVREFPYALFPFSSQKVIRFGPRCSPHECFELYAQQTNVYCAVATGQMILDFYRWYFTQDQIAAAMGTDASGTSNPGQVAGYESLTSNRLDATYDGSASWSDAKLEIDANRPLKSGIPGHARACAGWMRTWSWLPFGYDVSLKIYDPWPWNASICDGGAVVWEDWDAVTHTNFISIRHA